MTALNMHGPNRGLGGDDRAQRSVMAPNGRSYWIHGQEPSLANNWYDCASGVYGQSGTTSPIPDQWANADAHTRMLAGEGPSLAELLAGAPLLVGVQDWPAYACPSGQLIPWKFSANPPTGATPAPDVIFNPNPQGTPGWTATLNSDGSVSSQPTGGGANTPPQGQTVTINSGGVTSATPGATNAPAASTGFDLSSIPWWAWLGGAAAALYVFSKG
jgi:hypothetical protein